MTSLLRTWFTVVEMKVTHPKSMKQGQRTFLQSELKTLPNVKVIGLLTRFAMPRVSSAKP
jgi:hypothetical protein